MTRLLNLLVTVLLTMPAMSLAAQTLEIKLVNGRNGRPMVGTSAYVNVWVGGERKEAIAIPTDSNGVARLQLTLNPNDVNVPNSTGHGTIVANHPVVQYDESFRINVRRWPRHRLQRWPCAMKSCAPFIALFAMSGRWEEIGDMIPISTPQKIFSRVLQFNSRTRAQLNHGQVAQASTPEMVMRHEKLCPVHRVLCDERALR